MRIKGLGAAIAAFAALTACGPDYSTGSRTGVVTKLSYKGLIWKSWEGEAIIGGFRAGKEGAAVVNVFEFNIALPMVEKIRAAQKGGRPVELVYRQWALAPLDIGDDHVVIDVRDPDAAPAAPKEPQP